MGQFSMEISGQTGSVLSGNQQWVDKAVLTLSVLGYALPSFLLSLLLVLIFSVALGLLPTGGNTSWKSVIMPALTIAAGNAGLFARYVRSALLDVLPKPYLRAAAARGLNKPTILFAHALPNAAVPVLTILGLSAGSIVGGAVITETVFAWHGIGDLLVTSVARRDLAVVQAIVLLLAATMILSNLSVDLLSQRLDPRIRGNLRGADK